jgi:hypothetical protein
MILLTDDEVLRAYGEENSSKLFDPNRLTTKPNSVVRPQPTAAGDPG